LFNLSAEAY